jgi:hypothetical protein
MRYEDYPDNKNARDSKNSLSVPAPFLWDEIAKLRGCIPSKKYKKQWKILVGCSTSKGTYPNLVVTSAGRHYLTPREAAGILMLALWDGEVKAKVEPGLTGVSIKASMMPALFDKWMRLGPSSEALTLLNWIRSSKHLTYGVLAATVNDIAKKPIALSTLRGWVQRAGGQYRTAQPCPISVAMQVWAMVRAQAEPMKDAS